MSPRPQRSPEAMPAPGMSAASRITVQHAGGSIRVSVPTEVPVSELTLDLLEVVGLPDDDGWTLGPADGDPYPPERTLAQLGVNDGAVLALQKPPGQGSAGEETATTQRTVARAALGPAEGPGGRPLSARSARLLPVRALDPGPLPDRAGRARAGSPCRAARRRTCGLRPGGLHASRPALACLARARGVGGQRLPPAARADDRGAAAATVCHDCGRVAQGRRW